MKKAALQIGFVRLDVFGSAFRRRLHLGLDFLFRCRNCVRAGEATAQLCDDGLRELGLDREHVLQIARIIFRPEFFAGISPAEPRGDPHDVAGSAHTSFNQMRDAEFLTNFLGGGVLAFERKGRGPRGHMQSGNFLQHSQ